MSNMGLGVGKSGYIYDMLPLRYSRLRRESSVFFEAICSIQYHCLGDKIICTSLERPFTLTSGLSARANLRLKGENLSGTSGIVMMHLVSMFSEWIQVRVEIC
ncbi:hypothetical protein RND81_10G143200 [Saponaria officinalis]|uniref:Uncharacterized protein n=1 Tax=Saponaria officinalis TaxID=3572 RepID=A0AAW1I2M2_SAPOF